MQVLQNVLCQLVIDKARQSAKQNRALRTLFLKPYQTWKHTDYESLALMMQTSSSTVKRLFRLPGYQFHNQFNAANRQKIARFLGLAHWQQVEQCCLNHFVGESLSAWSIR